MRSYRPRFNRYLPNRTIVASSIPRSAATKPIDFGYEIQYTPRKKGQEKHHAGPLVWNSKKNSEDWDDNDKPYFCGEVSELEQVSNMGRFPRLGVGVRVTVKNADTNHKIVFECYGVDSSDSGEDIAGWRFKSVSGSKFLVEMLIIND